MNVSIFGLGYVGVVTSACLADEGNTVIGVDVNKEKVGMVCKGKSPIVEKGLSELLTKGIASNRLSATTSVVKAVANTDVSLVCVGSPSAPDGSTDLGHVFQVCQQLGSAIARKNEPHTVIIRSTVPPGTTKICGEQIRKLSGNARLHLAFNPEFLREGSAISDFHHPPFTIIGTDHDPVAEDLVRTLYKSVQSKVWVMEIEVAEMVKFTCNAWHAAKISFANEIGSISSALGIDGGKVMEIITKDNILNVSEVYMRPGFAFGGSCLPKDVRSLINMAKKKRMKVPLLSSILESNDEHITRSVQHIKKKAKHNLGKKRRKNNISILGLAFKSGTDDVRESPAVTLAKRLIKDDYKLKIYDRAVHETKLMGANKHYMNKELPDWKKLLTDDVDAIITHGEMLVVTHAAGKFRSIIEQLGAKEKIIDLASPF